jgi:hypothetical protein
MNTIAFVGAGVVLLLVVLAMIPGLEHAVRPIIALVFTALTALLEQAWSWTIWVFKLLLGAHFELIQHLIFSADTMDVTNAIRKNSEDTG